MEAYWIIQDKFSPVANARRYASEDEARKACAEVTQRTGRIHIMLEATMWAQREVRFYPMGRVFDLTEELTQEEMAELL